MGIGADIADFGVRTLVSTLSFGADGVSATAAVDDKKSKMIVFTLSIFMFPSSSSR